MQLYLHMVRAQWHERILRAWQEKSVVWLMGVRRTGKTTLCRELTPDGYFDCELPRVRKLLQDPELFFSELDVNKITLDEIHRLDNASEVLKIAADYFPKVKVLATGSSTLSASKKFKDTLTDRKRTVFLPPLGLADMTAFHNEDLMHRLIRGGLPPYFLALQFPESSYQEWLDSFWAKDIQELFRIENKNAFLKFFELLSLQSGGLYEAKGFASACHVSHTTIAAYLNVLAETNIVYVLRPFHKNAAKEIITAPKVYFFDTGFMTFFRGRTDISLSDRGHYWEHFVLNEILTFTAREDIHIWRDKAKNEVDFIIKKRGQPPIAIECKWNSKELNPKALGRFRELHPKGVNVLVAQDLTKTHLKKLADLSVVYTSLKGLKNVLLQ